MTAFTYTEAGLRATLKDARTYTTSYAYDWRGHLLSTTWPDSSVVSYGYDAFGNAIRMTNELGKVWETTYNAYQRVATRKDPLNRVTSYEYGLEPGCASCGFADTVSQITLPSGKKTAFTYDRSWKRISQTAGFGTSEAATTAMSYNAAGDQDTVTDGRGNVTAFTSDLLHRRLSVSDPLNHTTQSTYDDSGNVLTQTRANNGVTAYEYDSMNRRTKTTDPLLRVTKMAYDAAGNLQTLTDARSNAYGFSYDLINRKASMIYPGASHEDWTYDAVGNSATYRNRAGQTMTSLYDNRNRLKTESWTANGVTSIPLPSTRSRTYDVAGRLTYFFGSEFELAYAYDFADQLIYEGQNFANEFTQTQASVSYSYDLDGNRATLNAADGSQQSTPTIIYAYTPRNQVSSMTLAGSYSPLADFTYDLNGNRRTRSLENGTATFYVYDKANRVTSVDQRKGAASFARYDYVYNEVNNRISRGETLNGGTTQTDSYGYDATDQVTNVNYANGRGVTYNYDAVGNRTSVTDSTVPTLQPVSYLSNNLNQYTAATGSPSLNYDANGNLLNVPGNASGAVIYDAQSRPVSNVGDEQVFLDGLNRVMARGNDGHGIQPPQYQTHIYDGWNIVEDFNTAAGKQAVYIHGPQTDENLCRIDAVGNRVYYHQDVLCSTVALTNSSGDVAERYSYDINGLTTCHYSTGATSLVSNYANRFLFTGREQIGNSSVYDYRNRIYSSTLGRFLQTDPVRFAALDINLYRYVANDPTLTGDPDGQAFVDCCKALGDLTAALANFELRLHEVQFWPDVGHLLALKQALDRVKKHADRVAKHCAGYAGAGAALAAAAALAAEAAPWLLLL